MLDKWRLFSLTQTPQLSSSMVHSFLSLRWMHHKYESYMKVPHLGMDSCQAHAMATHTHKCMHMCIRMVTPMNHVMHLEFWICRFKVISMAARKYVTTETRVEAQNWFTFWCFLFFSSPSLSICENGGGVSLTGVCFEQAVCAPEVLRVFYHRDLSHANDDGIRAHLWGRRSVAAIGNVVERRGRVVVIADHRWWSWQRESERRNGGVQYVYQHL